MAPRLRKLVLALLKQHETLNLGTLRPDGWPQVTTVTYANDGLKIYFCCDRTSQKVRNIRHDPRVSLTIDRDCADWSKIKGLSLAGRARVVARPAEAKRAFTLLARKFAGFRDMSAEDRDGIAFVRIDPKVISVLDYTRGFGHTDLVRV